ncbi:3-isopropylmalate dehydratase large subunit [Oceanidesulfovibrio marinus]|uniref:3-isopropylmalate dehydratase large subunit n=1 Tax=Oceanidesulfovibrio marinus TaxID=370038 RepID=A0A6P1ZH56_9BACT|nr:3-isopropylmalate dehydratase large subunit [Oceanidesulfovibrio marinus]QJT10580.1 3-isopropylmalate dehydratase large subunit [Oceanidesulfovibrio marinus]TVM34188.1 3-isopropylmalate dehydratase large subunit [Oceanidesulfovibrio marinus]
MRRTLTEKLLAAHAVSGEAKTGSIVQCRVDLALANDITAPLAIKSFRAMGATKVFDKNKIALVMDHFTPNRDIASAEQVRGVREFAKEMGIVHYYEGGDCGVEHALLPELGLVGPGDVVVGADSHTCTYGALGAFATGMGSTDVAGAMVLGETWFKVPDAIHVTITGAMGPWVGGKDLILQVIGEIGVAGARYCVMEFDGPVIEDLSIEGRMTMANMAIEAGGKAGLFAADDKTLAYCAAHNRPNAEKIAADQGAEYQREVTIDVTGMSPRVAVPHLPENVKGVEECKGTTIQQAVIGSCTNGRIEDLREAAAVLGGRKVSKNVRAIILPATPAIWKQAMDEGLFTVFMDAGCVVGPPTCGPCLGGHMGILGKGERAISTTNRNFKGRMGHLESEVYLAGPAVAAASAVAGEIVHPDAL